MKGIIIYENDLGAINAVKLIHASFCYESVGNDITETLKGTPVICKSANCNKSDTYDFETGALIALMKMCRRDKVIKACDELYKDDNYKNALQEMTENNDKLIEENKKLQHEYNLCKNSENALKCSVDYLNKSIAKLNTAIYGYKEDLYKVAKHCKELEAENEKLKLDCEKLQHGYINTNKDSLTVDSLIEQSRAFTRKCVDEWLYRIPTKREEIWEKILEASKCPPVEIKVAKENITTFLRELQDKIPEVRWNGSDCPPTENTVHYWFKHDYIYFALIRNEGKGKLKLCYSEEPHSWIKTTIDYLSPMRWDLFKKGRLAVKVNYYNYKEFYEACEKELGKKPSTVYPDVYTVSICKKDGLFEVFTVGHQKTTGKKIVDWEDVRDKASTMEDPYDTWKW